MIKTIAFDADETLWGNVQHYRATRLALGALISPENPQKIVNELHSLERKNTHIYGFGVRSIMLNMVELAAQHQATAQQFAQIITIGQNLLQHSYTLFEGVEVTLKTLKNQGYTIICVTKGDLKDQKYKMQSSAIARYFDHIEVVVHKDTEEWRHLFKILKIKPAETVMIGDSLSSDILPALETGMHAVWIPQVDKPHFDEGEDTKIPMGNSRFKELSDITQTVSYIRSIP